MRLPQSVNNWLSYIGALIAILNLVLIFILFIISNLFDKGSSYLGLFIYIVLPGLMILGLLLIPIGMLLKRRKIRKTGISSTRPLPYLDLNEPRHRNAVVIFSVSTLLLLILTSIGSYEAYHFTESVEFCGTLCHEVMEPEYSAYKKSPHAHVTCVECHVGSGADWYMRSKLSGLHQVWAVLTDSFSRPIATPLHDLRPARETCEKCHWPQKFYPRTVHTNKYFLADETNSEWDLLLQMKTGPEYSSGGLTEGIHWHINPDVQVEYLSENDKRENIQYVKYTNKRTGETTLYTSEEAPVSDSVLHSASLRTMDCIDCHNRPSHNYLSPTVYFDEALLNGDVPKEIPFIKRTAMRILKQTYNEKDSALLAIEQGIRGYYSEKRPEYLAANKELIEKAIQGTQKGYSLNTFPKMKVNYDVYPDHIGHLETNGCFRCHNDVFKSDQGKVISKDCNLCHTIVGQGDPKNLALTNLRDTLEFVHPIDIGTDWKDYHCADCHRYLY